MWSHHLNYFELEVTTFKPAATTESLRAQYPADCDWFRSLLKVDPAVLYVSAMQSTSDKLNAQTQNIDCGNLIIFFNNGQAYVRLLEHRGWFLRDPLRAQQSNDSTQFLDESGELFSESFGNTLSRVQALSLLDCWLSKGIIPSEFERVSE